MSTATKVSASAGVEMVLVGVVAPHLQASQARDRLKAARRGLRHLLADIPLDHRTECLPLEDLVERAIDSTSDAIKVLDKVLARMAPRLALRTVLASKSAPGADGRVR